jgi:hypothetical protein
MLHPWEVIIKPEYLKRRGNVQGEGWSYISLAFGNVDRGSLKLSTPEYEGSYQ